MRGVISSIRLMNKGRREEGEEGALCEGDVGE
jgi:hypothetical protein